MNYWEITYRVACSFFVLMILTRLMGKKEIGQMNVFTFITAITIGNIAASLSTEDDLKVGHGVLALVGWAVLTILMGFINLKSSAVRKIIIGEPTILIRDGKIMEHALKKLSLDLDALQGMLRQKEIFSMKEVECAIYEIDGSLSILKKQDAKKGKGSFYKKTLLFPTSTVVISEGKINENALSDLHLSEKWLSEQLKKAGIQSISEVFFAEVQTDGSLYIDYKNDQLN